MTAANFQLTGLSAAKTRTNTGTSSSIVQGSVFWQRLFDRTLNRLVAIHRAHPAVLLFDRPCWIHTWKALFSCSRAVLGLHSIVARLFVRRQRAKKSPPILSVVVRLRTMDPSAISPTSSVSSGLGPAGACADMGDPEKNPHHAVLGSWVMETEQKVNSSGSPSISFSPSECPFAVVLLAEKKSPTCSHVDSGARG